jgi:beta-glucanase (GH16 family)
LRNPSHLYHALAALLVTGGCQGWQTQATSDPNFSTALPAEAAGYVLSFSDTFAGTELDTSKWRPRSLGKRRNGIVVEQASTLNGNGQLAMTLTQVGAEYHIAQIATHDTFLQKYGYFECRARVNHELGAHTAFWLQSPALGEGLNDPAQFGTEIDIFEYHINQGRSWVYHNLHWNGYGAEHKQAGTKVEIAGIDEGFHTFGLLWTADAYVFYVDGQETWRTSEAVSQIPQYIILSVELSGWGGDVTQATLPDEIIFDYVRVYASSFVGGPDRVTKD